MERTNLAKWCGAALVIAVFAGEVAGKPTLRGALLEAELVTEARIAELKGDDFNAIVLRLDNNLTAERELVSRAVDLVRKGDLAIYYWVEVGRSPELAAAQPSWMASQQVHPEWRRLFPETPEPGEDEVVKTYPWVPILSREPFRGQLDRVQELLADRPACKGVFLNDLQGAPSACGCGNPLCRWTSDYGDRRTTVPLGDDAAALFVQGVRGFVGDAEVIPVWTTECEQHDGAAHGLCAGVGCYDGICWKAYIRQLSPVEQICPNIGVLALFKLFQRENQQYAGPNGWVGYTVDSFVSMPEKNGGVPIPPSRLICVLQGWNVEATEITAQRAAANRAEVGGYVVSFAPIEQGWEPRIEMWR